MGALYYAALKWLDNPRNSYREPNLTQLLFWREIPLFFLTSKLSDFNIGSLNVSKDLDACLSETIDSFNLPKTPQNETEVDAGDNNIHEDVEPETAKSKTAKSKTGKVDVPESKIWTTVYVHDIDGISITEMGYQGDDEENGTGKKTYLPSKGL